TQVVEDHPSLAGADVEYRFVMVGGGTSCRGARDSSLSMSVDDPTVSTADGLYVTHGTHMVGLIAGTGVGYDGGLGFQGVAPGAHVIAYPDELATEGTLDGMACVSDDDNGAHPLVVGELEDAVASGARVVNMSFGLDGIDNWDVAAAALHALRHGVVLVSGRDNSSTAGMYDLVGVPGTNNYFPGEVTVNSAGRDGSISKESDVMDGNVSVLGAGVGVPVPATLMTSDREVVLSEGGTSSAAADLTGYLALVFQKWPGATGNQVLQSLVRNTRGNTSGEAVLDPAHRRGFGMVDPARLLSTDPSAYPDVNPLLEWAVKASDRHEETRGMYTGEYSGEYDTFVSDPFSPEGDYIDCTSVCAMLDAEYRRQAEAWAKVEECRKDGGKDCMQYSATSTADKADEDAGWVPAGSSSKSSSRWSGVPGWVVPVAGGVVLAVAGGVVFAVVVSRRRRKARAVPAGAVPAGPVPGVRPPAGLPAPMSRQPGPAPVQAYGPRPPAPGVPAPPRPPAPGASGPARPADRPPLPRR
ncbi:S8 family serine peptidase, partial [Bifidobacterium apri]|uniref:S8 family serine peptidase n=2 Tax=Bifidobacterium apri TaxID=1769423 RepID=UPI0039933928